MLHGWIPPSRFFAYLTTEDIAAMPGKAEAVVLQPVAAIEQHGPHLPVAVDTAIVMGVLGHALARLQAGVPCWCLPPICYGKSNEHVRFPGTVTVGASTLAALLGEERLAAIDRFDRVQLAEVVRCCRRHRSLSAAGRELFAITRQKRATANDADRLRKYLARFGLDHAAVMAGT